MTQAVGMAARYSVAQVLEIQHAVEQIADERLAGNMSLALIIAQHRSRVPTEVAGKENGLKRAALQAVALL